MDLNRKEKKFIKKQLKILSISDIADKLGHSEKEILVYLQKSLTKDKYAKLVQKKNNIIKENNSFDIILDRVNNFRFWDWFKNNWEFVFILALIVFGVYFNILKNDFLSDDIATIRDNPSLQNLSYVKIDQIPYFNLPRLSEHLTYSLFKLNPTAYHLINIGLHFGSTILVFILIGFFFEFPISLFSAAIFAVHPLLNETVAWISAQPYAIGNFFSLLAIIFFLKMVASKQWRYLIWVFILYFLAYSGSEKTAVLPLVFGLVLLLIPSYRRDSKIWKMYGIIFLQFVFWVIVLGGLIGVRSQTLQTTYYSSGGFENPFRQLPISLSTYLELFIAPIKLTFYHSEELIISTPQFIAKVVIFLIYISFIVYFFLKEKKIFFWLIYFPLMIATTLTPLRISWIVAERYAYLGVLGLIVTLAYLINKIGELTKRQYIIWIVFILIFSLYSARTVIRNLDWRNQDYLWLATDLVSPNSHQNHNNLGDLYYRRKDYQKAIEEFKKAIAIKPNYGDAFHNLANVYHQINDDDDALINYQTALTFNPSIWQSYLNIAAIYYNRGDIDNSIVYLTQAAQIIPDNVDIHNNLATLYLKKGDQAKAKEEFQKILALNPNDEKAKQFLQQVQQ